MTIIVASLEPRRVTVVTDTLKADGNILVSFGSKTMTWPHISAVAAFRGVTDTIRQAAVYFEGAALEGGVDGASKALGIVRDRVWDPERGLEGAFFGWSPQGRFIGWHFSAPDFERRDLSDGVHFWPEIEQELPEAAALALKPLALMLKDSLNRSVQAETGNPDAVSAGGELIETIVTAKGIEQRKIWRDPDYENMRNRIIEHRQRARAGC